MPIADRDRSFLIERGRPLVNSLKKTRILITGGTGVFGSWLLETLFAWNDAYGLDVDVFALSRNPKAFLQRRPHLALNPALTLKETDVRNFIPSSVGFDYVIHAATNSSHPGEVSKLAMFDTIVTGTRSLLELAVKQQPAGFLYVSSNAVYGRSWFGSDFIEETASTGPLVTDPNIEYDESKRMAEALCVLYAREHGVQTKIARCFPVVGPYLPLNTHFAIGNFIRDGIAGGPIFVNGDGSPVRSYIYLADLAIWLLTILVLGTTAYPYNVGSEEEITINNLAQLVADSFDPVRTVVIRQPPNSDTILSRFVPSTARSRQELGLVRAYSLYDSVQHTIEYYRQRG